MVEESKLGLPTNNDNFGMMRAMTYFKDGGAPGGSDSAQELKGFHMTSVACLLTALLRELSTTYVTSNAPRDVTMRSRIEKSVEIINSYQELSKLIIHGNPFRETRKTEMSSLMVPGAGVQVVPEYDGSESSQEEAEAWDSVKPISPGIEITLDDVEADLA